MELSGDQREGPATGGPSWDIGVPRRVSSLSCSQSPTPQQLLASSPDQTLKEENTHYYNTLPHSQTRIYTAKITTYLFQRIQASDNKIDKLEGEGGEAGSTGP